MAVANTINTRCPNCGYDANTPVRELYLRHMRVECPGCGKSYSAKDNLGIAKPHKAEQPEQPAEAQPSNPAVQSTPAVKNSKVTPSINTPRHRLNPIVPLDQETTTSQDNVSESIDTDLDPVRDRVVLTAPAEHPASEGLAADSANNRSPVKSPLDSALPKLNKQNNDIRHAIGDDGVNTAPDSIRDKTGAHHEHNEENEGIVLSAAEHDSGRRLEPIYNPNFPRSDVQLDAATTTGLTPKDDVDERLRLALPDDENSFDDVRIEDELDLAKPPLRSMLASSIIPCGLLLLLLLQTHFMWRDRLAQFVMLRPAMEKWCAISGCELKPIDSARVVDIVDSRLREIGGNDVELEFTLLNTTRYEAVMPTMEIHFSDFDENMIANFHLEPGQYSPLLRTLTANEQISFRVELAVNYSNPVSAYELRTVNYSP